MRIISKLICCLTKLPGRLHRVSFLRGLDDKILSGLTAAAVRSIFFLCLEGAPRGERQVVEDRYSDMSEGGMRAGEKGRGRRSKGKGTTRTVGNTGQGVRLKPANSS